jgi:hypothetical protein
MDDGKKPRTNSKQAHPTSHNTRINCKEATKTKERRRRRRRSQSKANTHHYHNTSSSFLLHNNNL